MQLTIRFGLDFDGYLSPVSATACGQVTLGPLGLLDQLETRLGLRARQSGAMLRVTRYLQCLRQADTAERFYSRSLAVDPLTVARTLLFWRDTWLEAGWDGSADAGDAPRVSDMAAVEAHTGELLPAGIADRLRLVAKRLETEQLPLTLELLDPLEDFSALWQRILHRLGAVSPAELIPWAQGDTDLARLQRGLLIGETFQFSGDGSVLLLSARDNRLLGRALASIGHGGLPADSCCADTLPTQVVSDHSLADFDRTAWGEDLPLPGCSDASAWRPPLQVLPLALGLFWEPLDPYRLLEFLTHPVCPVPGYARRRLAEVVAEAPGMGGKPWRDALDKLCQQAVDKAEGDPAAGQALRERFALWCDLPRHDPREGAPLTLLAEHCARLSRWMSARAEAVGTAPELRALFRAAASQAREAQLCLDDWRGGEERISRLQLERLLEDVTASGTPLPDHEAEVGALPVLRAPGAAVAAAPRMVWWDFTEPQLPGRLPWSRQEQAALERSGARFIPAERQFESLRRRWQRPILAAEQQLVLLQPKRRCGEPARLHPLGNLIEALAGKTLPTLDLDRELAGEFGALRLELPLEEQPPAVLPPLRRWWQFADGELLGRREEESFSSLEAFLFSPYQWLLKYKAQLRGGALSRIADGKRLKGTLFHRLVELLLTDPAQDWRNLDDEALTRVTATTLDRLFAEEGAVFLLPGQRREKQALHDIACRSVIGLIRQLRAAKVVDARLEEKDDGHFTGGRLAGAIDLLVTNDQGQEAVIDLKWGGGKYRVTELKENRALQLALYAWLRKKEGRWPAQAYYILSESRFLAQNRDYFPIATVCPPADDNAHAGTLWVEFEKAWRWRREQFDRGLVEITVTGTEADADSSPPEDALSIPETYDTFNDFRSLTGWKEGA
ncbi:MAG: PD-(D/E)XK nuclease family protein [Desulfuromonadales bacterium]